MWWGYCAGGAFMSVSVIVSALDDDIPAWVAGVGVTQLVVVAVLAWQFERFRTRPENAIVPLLVGLVPQLVLSVAFDEVQDGIGRVLGLVALALVLLAVALVLFRNLRSSD
jgi:hypothetical protein